MRRRQRLNAMVFPKAGQNDCANAAGTHSCAGQSTLDFDGGEWKAVSSADKCSAEGGSLEPWRRGQPRKIISLSASENYVD